MTQGKITVSGSAKTLTVYNKIKLPFNYNIIIVLTKIKLNNPIISFCVKLVYAYHIINKFSNNITLLCFLFGGQND